PQSMTARLCLRRLTRFSISSLYLFFFFLDTAPPELYTLSLHDALPICRRPGDRDRRVPAGDPVVPAVHERTGQRRLLVPRHAAADRKSTRLNSSHVKISYAVFCLKKKKK